MYGSNSIKTVAVNLARLSVLPKPRAAPPRRTSIPISNYQLIVMTGGTPGADHGSDYNRFATCTECIGFESLTEKDIHCSLTDQGQLAAAVSPPVRRREETKQCKVFPPFMSSLCENGRPRFNLVKVRDNGRLGIAAIPNRGHEVLVVRTTPEEGGHVRIRSLDNFSASEF